jgi:hypothetical protein
MRYKKRGNLIILPPAVLSRFKDVPEDILRTAVLINHVLRKLESDPDFQGIDKDILYDTAAIVAKKLDKKKTLDQACDEEINKIKVRGRMDFEEVFERIFGRPPPKNKDNK